MSIAKNEHPVERLGVFIYKTLSLVKKPSFMLLTRPSIFDTMYGQGELHELGTIHRSLSTIS